MNLYCKSICFIYLQDMASVIYPVCTVGRWEFGVSTDGCVTQEFQFVAADVLKDLGKTLVFCLCWKVKEAQPFDCKGSRSRTKAKRTRSLARNEGRQARDVLWFPHPLVVGLSLSWSIVGEGVSCSRKYAHSPIQRQASWLNNSSFSPVENRGYPVH